MDQMNETKWLACRVEPGMFSSERLVTVTLDDGREVSFLVPREAVREPEDQGLDRGYVHVRVLEREGRTWMEIPCEQPVYVPAKFEDLAAA